MQAKERHRLIADLVAAATILSMVVYVGLALTATWSASFAALGGFALGVFTFLLLMSATKLYGTGVLKAVKDVGGKMFDAAITNGQNK